MQDTKPFHKISILIPTRGRVERLGVVLDSYFKTTGDMENVELIFRTDKDDPATKDFLLEQHFRGKIIVGPRLLGYASMPTFFNEMWFVSTGDVLLCGNDDMIFRTAGWPQTILDEANRYPDGLFDFGVSTLNETHLPFSIVSRKAADCMGFLWDPTIFWGDIFLRDVMTAFGRAIMIPSVKIDHDWAGNNPDQVFLEGDKNITMHNPTYWTTTHARAVEDAVKALQVLKERAA